MGIKFYTTLSFQIQNIDFYDNEIVLFVRKILLMDTKA